MTWILLVANVAVLTAIAVAYRRATSTRQVQDLTDVDDQFCRAGVRVAAAG